MLFDLLARNGGAVLGLPRVRGGQHLGGFLLRLLGLFVAFVLFLGHFTLPVCAGKAAKGAGRARKTSGADRKVCGAEPVGSRWGFAGGKASVVRVWCDLCATGAKTPQLAAMTRHQREKAQYPTMS